MSKNILSQSEPAIRISPGKHNTSAKRGKIYLGSTSIPGSLFFASFSNLTPQQQGGSKGEKAWDCRLCVYRELIALILITWTKFQCCFVNQLEERKANISLSELVWNNLTGNYLKFSYLLHFIDASLCRWVVWFFARSRATRKYTAKILLCSTNEKYCFLFILLL